MTYEQVVALVGTDGTLQSESSIGGEDTKTYKWTGSGGIGAYASVEFQNDMMTFKSQAGLK